MNFKGIFLILQYLLGGYQQKVKGIINEFYFLNLINFCIVLNVVCIRESISMFCIIQQLFNCLFCIFSICIECFVGGFFFKYDFVCELGFFFILQNMFISLLEMLYIFCK